MTLVGCMQDGLLGDPTVLLAKGTMDLFSSIFLAAALGRGCSGRPAPSWSSRAASPSPFATLGTGIPESLITDSPAWEAFSCWPSDWTCSTSENSPSSTSPVPALLPLILALLDALYVSFSPMPANKYALLRYRIIDRCLTNRMRPYPTKEDLRRACEEGLYGSEGERISISTIEKDLWAMRNENEWAITRPSSTMPNTAATNTRTPTTASADSTSRNRTSRPSGLPP